MDIMDIYERIANSPKAWQSEVAAKIYEQEIAEMTAGMTEEHKQQLLSYQKYIDRHLEGVNNPIDRLHIIFGLIQERLEEMYDIIEENFYPEWEEAFDSKPDFTVIEGGKND